VAKHPTNNSKIEGSNPAAEKPGKRKWGLKGRSSLAELVPPVEIFILNFIQKIGTKIQNLIYLLPI
jgi:hypothetical protein